jgi:hypothetical protein
MFYYREMPLPSPTARMNAALIVAAGASLVFPHELRKPRPERVWQEWSDYRVPPGPRMGAALLVAAPPSLVYPTELRKPRADARRIEFTQAAWDLPAPAPRFNLPVFAGPASLIFPVELRKPRSDWPAPESRVPAWLPPRPGPQTAALFNVVVVPPFPAELFKRRPDAGPQEWSQPLALGGPGPRLAIAPLFGPASLVFPPELFKRRADPLPPESQQPIYSAWTDQRIAFITQDDYPVELLTTRPRTWWWLAPQPVPAFRGLDVGLHTGPASLLFPTELLTRHPNRWRDEWSQAWVTPLAAGEVALLFPPASAPAYPTELLGRRAGRWRAEWSAAPIVPAVAGETALLFPPPATAYPVELLVRRSATWRWIGPVDAAPSTRGRFDVLYTPTGTVVVFRLTDASRPDVVLRERSHPDAQLDAIDRPDAILRDQGRPELEAENQSRPDATLRDRSRP